MPITVPVPTKIPGDVITSSLWNSYVRDNLNKLLNTGHRALTVAQFAALTGVEDGDEVYLEADATNGIYWHLRYRAASGSSFKWEFLGGPPLHAIITTGETTASAILADLATIGPSITVPRSGDYDAEFGVYGVQPAFVTRGQAGIVRNNVDQGAQVIILDPAGSGLEASPARIHRLAAMATGDVLKLRYLSSNGANAFSYAHRWLRIRPSRIA